MTKKTTPSNPFYKKETKNHQNQDNH